MLLQVLAYTELYERCRKITCAGAGATTEAASASAAARHANITVADLRKCALHEQLVFSSEGGVGGEGGKAAQIWH